VHEESFQLVTYEQLRRAVPENVCSYRVDRAAPCTVHPRTSGQAWRPALHPDGPAPRHCGTAALRHPGPWSLPL